MEKQVMRVDEKKEFQHLIWVVKSIIVIYQIKEFVWRIPRI